MLDFLTLALVLIAIVNSATYSGINLETMLSRGLWY